MSIAGMVRVMLMLVTIKPVNVHGHGHPSTCPNFTMHTASEHAQCWVGFRSAIWILYQDMRTGHHHHAQPNVCGTVSVHHCFHALRHAQE